MRINAVIYFSLNFVLSNAFSPHKLSCCRLYCNKPSNDDIRRPNSCVHLTTGDENKSNESEEKKLKQADVMAFLRRKGAVGKNKDFSTAMGVDEGPVGKNRSQVRDMQKAKAAYQWCTTSGIVDDISENFPMTSSGSEWSGFTDQVMGGVSVGKLLRETVDGRKCNVMKGKVSTYNNGGFIQMATDLSKDPAISLTVDASAWDGVEIDVYYQGKQEQENFNVHLKNSACERQFSSYRATFEAKQGEWQTVRLPFSEFVGYGPGAKDKEFESTALRRLSIVAIGKPMDVYLGVGKVGFYRN